MKNIPTMTLLTILAILASTVPVAAFQVTVHDTCLGLEHHLTLDSRTNDGAWKFKGFSVHPGTSETQDLEAYYFPPRGDVVLTGEPEDEFCAWALAGKISGEFNSVASCGTPPAGPCQLLFGPAPR